MPKVDVDTDQLTAELELERAEHKRWRIVAHLLAQCLLARVRLDQVELGHTLRTR